MKSPKIKSIGEVVTDYGAKVMKVFKEGLLGRSLFDFYGDVKALTFRTKEVTTTPGTPPDGKGGVIYTKSADGKLYYKSNEVAEVELSASDTVLTTEQVQDIAGPLVATGGTKTGITITYDDANNDMDFVVDHDAATNYVAEEHYRWDNDIQSTATINHLNLSSDTPGESEVLVMNDGDAVWGHGEKIYTQVRNDEGSTIPAGAPLYSRGEIGGSNRILVGICDADDSAKMPCIGIAHSEMNTTSTKDNFAVVSGIYNTNISGFTSLAVSDILYVNTSGSAPYLTQTKPTGESSLIQNVGIVLRTNGSTCLGMLVSTIGRTNDVPNLNSGYIFYGNGSNQAVSTQLSTLLPPDLTVDGAGTIHANNVPTLNQDTTGNAATATTAQGITGATDGDVNITSDGEVIVKLDSDNDEVLQKFKVTDNADAVVFSVDEGGAIFTSAGTISNTGSDNDLAIQSDGSMTFTIDRDNDETSQKFSFVNYNTEIANLDESGNLQIDGDLTVSGGNITNAVTFDSGITDSGTIAAGTWNGTAIASSYLDADTAHLTTDQTFTGAKTFDAKVTLDGDKNITPSGDGVTLHVDAQDITDTDTAASGTTGFFNHAVFENPRLLATNASVTTTEANTVYIKGAPVASTNQTITTANSLKVAAGNVDFGADLAVGANLNVTGIITGKQREIYSQSFLDDLNTTKHYLPWKDINEQTTVYQEEAAMVMPCDGRIVSVTVRVASVTGSGNMTIGIESIAPNINSFGSANWTEEETETLAVTSTDDYHVFHFAFDNAKHFDSGDLVSISIQNDADLSGTTYWYVSTVVEYDWNTFLGTTSAEYDSNP